MLSEFVCGPRFNPTGTAGEMNLCSTASSQILFRCPWVSVRISGEME